MKSMRLVIIIFGGLVIITAIILVVLRVTGEDSNTNTESNANVVQNLNTTTATTNTVTNTTTNTNSTVDQNLNTTVTTPPNVNDSSLKAIARSFAERFGTFSNHSDYENIEHLVPYMTQNMKDWATEYVADQRAEQAYDGIYFGTTTRTLSTKTVRFNESDGLAEYMVNTQRKESTGSTSNARTYYQDIQIIFVNEQSVWKVDQAWWQ